MVSGEHLRPKAVEPDTGSGRGAPSSLAPWLPLIVVLAAGTLLNVLTRAEAPLFTKYPTAATQLLGGALTVERLGDFSPGYLFFFSALKHLGLDGQAVVTLQLWLLTVAAALVGLAAARLGGPRPAALAAALLLLSRPAVANASELEPETLLLLLVAGAVLALAHASDSQGGKAPVIAGAMLGLAAGVRPTAVLAALVVGGLLALRGWRTAARFSAGFVGPAVAGLGAVMALTGTLALMDPGAVFLEGNGPLATGYTGVQPQIVNDVASLEGVPDAIHLSYRSVASRAAGRSLSRDEANDYWRTRAMAFVSRHPLAAAMGLARKAWFTAHDYDSWDTPALEARRAVEEAPGDHNVLATRAVLAELAGHERDALTAREELQAFHDPFTAQLALATAERALRRDDRWKGTLAGLTQTFAAWSRPMTTLRE